MGTERHSFGLDTFLPQNYRNRAEAFAKCLHEKLKLLGGHDEGGEPILDINLNNNVAKDEFMVDNKPSEGLADNAKVRPPRRRFEKKCEKRVDSSDSDEGDEGLAKFSKMSLSDYEATIPSSEVVFQKKPRLSCENVQRNIYMNGNDSSDIVLNSHLQSEMLHQRIKNLLNDNVNHRQSSEDSQEDSNCSWCSCEDQCVKSTQPFNDEDEEENDLDPFSSQIKGSPGIKRYRKTRSKRSAKIEKPEEEIYFDFDVKCFSPQNEPEECVEMFENFDVPHRIIRGSLSANDLEIVGSPKEMLGHTLSSECLRLSASPECHSLLTPPPSPNSKRNSQDIDLARAIRDVIEVGKTHIGEKPTRVEFLTPETFNCTDDLVDYKDDIVDYKDDIVDYKDDIVDYKDDIVYSTDDKVDFIEDDVCKADIVDSVENINVFTDSTPDDKDHIVDYKDDIVDYKDDIVDYKDDIVYSTDDKVDFIEDDVCKADIVDSVEDIVVFTDSTADGKDPIVDYKEDTVDCMAGIVDCMEDIVVCTNESIDFDIDTACRGDDTIDCAAQLISLTAGLNLSDNNEKRKANEVEHGEDALENSQDCLICKEVTNPAQTGLKFDTEVEEIQERSNKQEKIEEILFGSTETTKEVIKVEVEPTIRTPKISVTEYDEDDDNDSDMNPRMKLRRCSSLKTWKTPPGTPGRKKIVRFADALGLDLADIRTFLDEIPKIPNSAFEDLHCDLPDPAPPKLVRTLIPLFQQPGGQPDFIQRVRQQNVCLENAVLTDPSVLTLTGCVRVRNLDYNKSVHIRYTIDNWNTFSDLQATYIPNSCDGFSDKFSFVLYGHTLQLGQRIEFAVKFQSGGALFWDSNDGMNYGFQCIPPTPSVCFLPSTTQSVDIQTWSTFY